MREAEFGGIKMTTVGPQEPDDADRPLESYGDDALIRALAYRGYDVTVRVPKPGVVEKRKADAEKRRAAKKGGRP